MRKIETIDSNKWLNIVNSESHPDLGHYELHTYNFGDLYAIVINSGYGVFISDITKDASELDELEKKVLHTYEMSKGTPIIKLNSPDADKNPVPSMFGLL